MAITKIKYLPLLLQVGLHFWSQDKYWQIYGKSFPEIHKYETQMLQQKTNKYVSQLSQNRLFLTIYSISMELTSKQP